MVNAKLYIICGNCGCGDEEELSFSCDAQGSDCETHFEPTITITCANCSTRHTFYGIELKDKRIAGLATKD